jgi:hypothetical protein
MSEGQKLYQIGYCCPYESQPPIGGIRFLEAKNILDAQEKFEESMRRPYHLKYIWRYSEDERTTDSLENSISAASILEGAL